MKKKSEKNARKNINKKTISLIIVFIIVILAAIFYLLNQDKMDRRGDIVGDGICGDFGDEYAQDSCCADVHAEEFHVLCEGEWKYLSGVRKCQYVCIGELPSCTEDFRVCESGDVVGRNPNQDCEFNSCP
jgi:hypothetical protein